MRIQLRSGDFPEGGCPERETMQKEENNVKQHFHSFRRWMAAAVAALGVVLLLSGCTRREELAVQLDEGAAESLEVPEAEQSAGDAKAAAAEDGEEQPEVSQEQEMLSDETLYIHVCGAVCRPGVYEMKQGDRVYEAVQKAGGFTEDADEDYVNQAQKLTDGAKLVIPTKEESSRLAGEQEIAAGLVGEEIGEAAGTDGDGRININTASESELCQIPGVGATRAAAIISYREKSGSFRKIEDIMNVSGIKEGTFEKIKDSIRVE